MIVRAVGWGDPAAFALRAAQRAELEIRYGTPDNEPGPAPTAEDIIVFFVAFGENDEPLGCGGLRAIGTPEAGIREAEIKRMYVAPSHRGTGVANAILDTLENFGREQGWPRLILETGTAQPDAIRFYEREGYTAIPL